MISILLQIVSWSWFPQILLPPFFIECGQCIKGNTNLTQSEDYKCGVCKKDLLNIIKKYKGEMPQKYREDCSGTCGGQADKSECGVCLKRNDYKGREACELTTIFKMS